MSKNLAFVYLLTTIVSGAIATPAIGQNQWFRPISGNYSNSSNWSSGRPPEQRWREEARFDQSGTYNVSFNDVDSATDSWNTTIINGNVMFENRRTSIIPHVHQIRDSLRIDGGSLTLNQFLNSDFVLDVDSLGTLTIENSTGNPTALNVRRQSTVLAPPTNNLFGSSLVGAVDADSTLNIRQGGSFETYGGITVTGRETPARINVSGRGSQLIASEIAFRSTAGESHFNIDARAVVDINGAIEFGASEAGAPKPASLTVSGTDSQLNVLRSPGISNHGSAIIHSGTVRIESAAKMTVANTTYLGRGVEHIANATVSGSGSVFATGSLQVGDSEGRGTLNIIGGGRVNADTIASIDRSSSIKLNNGTLNVVGSIDNRGQITGEGTSTINGQLAMTSPDARLHVQSGQTNLFGSLAYDDGEIRIDDGSVLLIAGEAIGVGSYLGDGQVVFAETLSPGNSAAAIGFEGDVKIELEAATMMELGGMDAGEFDQLLIDGNLDVGGGPLLVSLIDDFVLRPNQRFLIADVEGEQTGQFNDLGEGAVVDTFNGVDLFITYRGFGDNGGVGLFTAVPEPSGAIMLATIGSTVLARRKRRR